MKRLENTSLSELAQLLWGEGDEFRNYHGKLYALTLPSHERLLQTLNAIQLSRESFPNRHPATALIGDFSKIVTLQAGITPYVGRDNKLIIKTSIDKRELPSCDYFCLISPYVNSEGRHDYSKALESIRFLRSIFCLVWGHLSTSHYVGEFDFDSAGKVSQSTQPFRMPQHSDFLKVDGDVFATQLSERLGLQLQPFRDRILRASTFMSAALDQTDEAFRFAAYWISLEVLVGGGGGAPAIRNALALAYQCDLHSVDERLLLRDLATKRNELTHHGGFDKLFPYEERLLQLYFADIMLQQLNLPHLGLAEAVVKSGLVEKETAMATRSNAQT